MKTRQAARAWAFGLLLLLPGLFGLLLATQNSAARPLRQSNGELPPSTTPYIIGFDDPNSPSSWNTLTGDWALRSQRYVQTDASAVNAAALYRLGINATYSVNLVLGRVTGRFGGVVINAASDNSLVLANVVRYDAQEGRVEVGSIDGDGSFQVIGAVSVATSNPGNMILRVEAGESSFNVYFEGNLLGTYALTNRPAPAYVGVYTNLGSFNFADVTVEVGIDNATDIDLNPQADPYAFAFSNSDDLADWAPGRGVWTFSDPGYAQTTQDEEDNFSFYGGRINGNFTLDVSLSLLEGNMGGGVLFNAPTQSVLRNAMLLAFDPAAATNGAAVYWGYFDDAEVFQELGRADVDAPTQLTDLRTLTVALTDDQYTLSVDGAQIQADLPLPEATGRVAQSYFGFYATDSSVNFLAANVTVTSSADIDATATAALTETPSAVPTATATETPLPGSLLPENTYTFNFTNMGDEERTRWRTHRGDWAFDGNGLNSRSADSDAMIFYNFKVYGDYEITAEFLYGGGEEISADVGAGVIFNASSQNINDSFIVAYKRDPDQSAGDQSRGISNLAWGFFSSGVFRRISQYGISSSPQHLNKNEVSTIKIKVEGGKFSVWLNGTAIVDGSPFTSTYGDNTPTPTPEPPPGRVDEAYIGLYSSNGTIYFKNVTVQVLTYAEPTPTPTPTLPPTPTRGPTPTPYPSALPQTGGDPLRIGYSPAGSGQQDSINNWLAVQGEWTYNNGYIIQGTAAEEYFAVYRFPLGRIPEGGDYTYSVTAAYLDGEMGAGIFFNSPEENSLDRSYMVRFVPDSTVPRLEWGYYSGGAFRLVNSQVAPRPNEIKSHAYRFTISVTSEQYSLWIDDELIVENEFLEPESRHLQPYVGVFASQGRVRFTDAEVIITEENLPTATPTNTTRPVTQTPTQTSTAEPTRTPTPTYTVTPGPATPTNTGPPASPTNTQTPIIIPPGAALPTATQTMIIATPPPPSPSILQLTGTAVAAMATSEEEMRLMQQATLTAQFFLDQQTATALAVMQQVTPTPQSVAQATMPPPSPMLPDDTGIAPGAPNNVTPAATEEVRILVVTNTPTATQRPIPAPTPASSGSFLGNMLRFSTQAALWVWLVAGLLLFLLVAGMAISVFLLRRTNDPYALYGEGEEEELERLEQMVASPPPVASPPDATPDEFDENWPSSLP
ncbi:MAG: DUF1080 domain-containing protein [Caldilineaceae bacterium]|nr:DUF1080 domain-containing protein [Caldilineaceae bacterium]